MKHYTSFVLISKLQSEFTWLNNVIFHAEIYPSLTEANTDHSKNEKKEKEANTKFNKISRSKKSPIDYSW